MRRSRPPTSTAKLKRRARGITTGEFAFVRGLTRRTPKVTMPAPSLVHFFRGEQTVDRAVYPDLDAFWSDLIAIYHAELRALADLGCTYVQLDEVPVRDAVRSAGARAREVVRLRARRAGRDLHRAVDEIADRRPAGMGIALHLCRGNYKGHWMAEGGYEPVAERLFNAEGRRVLPGIRYGARRRLRAAAPGAERQGGRARPRQQQERRSSNRSTSSGGASTRRAATSRSSGWRSVRNAGLPAASAAIR